MDDEVQIVAQHRAQADCQHQPQRGVCSARGGDRERNQVRRLERDVGVGCQQAFVVLAFETEARELGGAFDTVSGSRLALGGGLRWGKRRADAEVARELVVLRVDGQRIRGGSVYWSPGPRAHRSSPATTPAASVEEAGGEEVGEKFEISRVEELHFAEGVGGSVAVKHREVLEYTPENETIGGCETYGAVDVLEETTVEGWVNLEERGGRTGGAEEVGAFSGVGAASGIAVGVGEVVGFAMTV